ncbi:MAG: hypothetical protein M3P49_06870 [Actinomycetota bacterium]|nr:hypothetical protein [Actinomycetota bacterium]
MERTRREPGTQEEWQRAADAASALLVIEAVRIPNPDAVEISRGACEDVLRRARELGIEPSPSALGRYAAHRAALGVPPDPERDLAGLPPRRAKPRAARRR